MTALAEADKEVNSDNKILMAYKLGRSDVLDSIEPVVLALIKIAKGLGDAQKIALDALEKYKEA